MNIKFFPKVIVKNASYLIMSHFESNSIKPNKTKNDFLKSIIEIHSMQNNSYGFKFDTQIGGLKQINTKSKNWVEFYGKKRLGYVFNLINKSNPMDKEINNKIDILLKKLSEYIPNNPKASLLHGDLWEGNILFLKIKILLALLIPVHFMGIMNLKLLI